MHSHPRSLTVPALFAALAYFAIGGSRTNNASISSRADSTAVVKVVTDFQNALAAGDSAKALSLLASDAVILESGGIETRSEYRSHHLPEDIEFARTVTSRRGPLYVRVEGSSAWTAGTSTTRGSFKDRPIDSMGAESMVLTKQRTGWRIRSIHWSSRKRTTSS